MHKGGWGFRPTKPAKKCIGWVEKRSKEKKGKNQAKIGKIRLKITKRGGKSRKINKSLPKIGVDI